MANIVVHGRSLKPFYVLMHVKTCFFYVFIRVCCLFSLNMQNKPRCLSHIALLHWAVVVQSLTLSCCNFTWVILLLITVTD